MKKQKRKFTRIFLVLLYFILTTAIFAAGISPKPGGIRAIKPVIIQAITDDKKDFFLKYPRKIYGDEKGKIFVVDDKKVLMFDGEGNYIKQLVSKGQGPGEVTQVAGLLITDNNIIILNNYPGKLILLDKKGAFQQEFRIYEKGLAKLAAYYDKAYYLFNSGFPESTKGSRYIDLDKNLFAVDGQGQLIKNIHAFPVKQYYVVHQDGQGLFGIGELLFKSYKDRYLLISHTQDYLVKIFDLKEQKVVRKISRVYSKQEIPEEMVENFHRGQIELNGKRFKKPLQKHFNDIQKLSIYKDDIWVVTSTVDKIKGVLVDVYSFEGTYEEAFYLKLSDKVDHYKFDGEIFGDNLLTIEYNDEGIPSIVKYRLDF